MTGRADQVELKEDEEKRLLKNLFRPDEKHKQIVLHIAFSCYNHWLTGCSRDVVFLIDDTTSINPIEFQNILYFLGNVINHLDIGPSATQVAMVTFDSGSHVQWYLNTHQNKTTLLSALHRVHPYGGNEHAADALLFIESNILVGSHGDRPSAPDVVLFLTDGHSVDGRLQHAAQQLRAKSSDIVAIGVEQADMLDLVNIATDRQHIINVRDFQSLLPVVSRVVSLICH
ncbi:hypothetical protein CHS0354_016560 [Potamilus streckersoni]|uniref:VWFA domain-containing protein n=1 Tax=Potamilus streckersoni TaxID=2493646 RepID=A0AAE0TLQ1_9BIVA|nr:hypothetical protein CHS0354_016560 [Potamilus streckersoni]